MTGWFRMHDAEPDGMIAMPPREAQRWNEQGFGIFATVQRFRGARRLANLERIRAWAIDIDDGTKDEQAKRLLASPLIPSSIVETKSGYHAYWYAKDGKREHYRALLDRLVAFFGADKNARDLARVLRVPGFLHQKDPAEPFLVQHVHGPYAQLCYAERQMFDAFPPVEDEAREQHQVARREVRESSGEDFWERVYNLDCLDGLERLSGHHAVGGEHFTFRRVSSGNHNILVDGKGTSCWIDESGRIGSSDKGGPTLYQWLRWYGNSPADCARILKETYPHLEDCR